MFDRDAKFLLILYLSASLLVFAGGKQHNFVIRWCVLGVHGDVCVAVRFVCPDFFVLWNNY